ncbi:MAG: hypothetical protein NTX24_05460 [Candidatus Pacearchaeota archaeon]|nr:hypothetical protein [Candidatus Pacearchaeota archaeon]
MTKTEQVKMGKSVIASGPIIIQNKKMLVVLDDKDPFLKFPGGSLFKGKTLKETCILETKLEIKCDIGIIKELEPMLLWKCLKIKDFRHPKNAKHFLGKPHTGEKIPVILIHWLAKIKKGQKPSKGKHTKKIIWIDSHYKGYKLAPNVQYFLKKLKKEKKTN